jgi:hypothetical protein
VEQYDLDTGETIATFSTHGAAQRATGVDSSSISKCIRKLATRAGRYGWRLAGDSEADIDDVDDYDGRPARPHGIQVPQPVEQYDLDTGETIATFPSQIAAHKATGVDSTSISNCVRGKGRHGGGYGWRRVETVGGAGAGRYEDDEGEEEDDDEGHQAD